jgi:hypothetical protein
LYSLTLSGEPYYTGTAAVLNTPVPGTNKLTISFTDAAGFNPKQINYYSLNNDDSYPYVVLSNPFDITGLTTVTTYYIKLKSVNSVGFQVSNTVSGEPLIIGSAPVVNSVTPAVSSLSVAFSESTGGNPVPMYYYSLDGTTISGTGVTKSPIVIPNLTIAQYYTFYIVALNSAGNVFSLSASGQPLLVGSAPVINEVTPQKNSLLVNYTKSIGGNPEATYYYSFDRTTLLGTGTSGSSITIPNLTVAQYYTFYIVAVNSAGNVISSPASGKPLIIGSVPFVNTITPAINSLLVNYTVSMGGNPAPTYYYSFDGIALLGTGVSGTSMTIPNLTEGRYYKFYIIASNSAGNVVSTMVSGKPLVVGSAPVVNKVTPQKNALLVNYTGSIGASPLATYYYSFDGETPLGVGVSGTSITIPDLNIAQYYSFYIIASNTAGNIVSLSASGQPLIIGNAPVINTVTPQPNSLLVNYSASTGGNPEPMYYYSFNGETPLGVGVSGTSIIIPNLTIAKYYSFYIIAVNSAGNTVSQLASGLPLIIGSAPVINTVTPGTNSLTVNFSESIGGNPVPMYYYSFDRDILLGSGVSGTSITIPGLTEAKYYTFYIVASSSAGNSVSLSASGEPLVLGSAPIINTVIPGTNNLTVYFTGSLGGNPPAKYYYSVDGSPVMGSGVSSSPIVIPNLTQPRDYTFNIIASNAVGNVTSLPGVGKPFIVGSVPIINSVTPAFNSLSIGITQTNKGNPLPTYYYSFDGFTRLGQGTTSSSIVIPDLTIAKYYSFYIIASNAAGNSVSLSASGEPFVVGSEPVITGIEPGVNKLSVSFLQLYEGNPIASFYYSLDGVTLLGTGVSTSPIVIPDLLLAQNYPFYIFAKNAYGRLRSIQGEGMPLVIGSEPVINKVMSQKNSLTVEFTQPFPGNPPSKYYYSFDRTTLLGTGVYGTSITIPNLTVAQVYTFFIVASNPIGNVVSLSASGEPYVIGTSPIIRTVTPAVNSLIVSFFPSIGGNPTPRYYYSFNGVDTSGSGVDYSINSTRITIPNLTLSKFYTIYLIASNAAGDVASPPDSTGKPLVIGNVPDITRVTPAANSLIVDFVQTNPGNPLPTYYYSFDGISTDGSGVSTSQITIPNLLLPQYYTFYIISTNSVGTVISLDSSGKPYIIGTPPVVSDASSILNGLVVSFSPSIGGNPTPDTYYYSLNGGDYVDSEYSTSPITIRGLTQPNPYSIVLKAHNLIGNTSASNYVFGTPYIIGTDPIIYEVSSGINSMSVSFMGSAFGYPPPVTYFYSIDGENYIDAQTTTSPILIGELTKFGPYNVILIAGSLAGYTNPSNTVVGRAYVIGDAPIISNIITNFNDIAVAFSNNGAYPVPTNYYYSIDDINYILVEQTDETPLRINNLVSNTGYTLSLYSSNFVGPSPIISVFVRTLSEGTFYASVMNPKYNLKAPIIIGAQPKSDLSTSGGTNQTAVSTRAKFSRYVGGTAGSRR